VAYSTQADVSNALGGDRRLVQTFDWDGDGIADAAVVTDCVAEADALIDSFASKRFHVPFNPVPEIIRRTRRSSRS
jgi:phage gp36-like protein